MPEDVDEVAHEPKSLEDHLVWLSDSLLCFAPLTIVLRVLTIPDYVNEPAWSMWIPIGIGIGEAVSALFIKFYIVYFHIRSR